MVFGVTSNVNCNITLVWPIATETIPRIDLSLMAWLIM